MTTPTSVELRSWPWPEIAAGDDLAAMVVDTCDLATGDVVVLTSKVVSKAAGLLTSADRADVIAQETRRVVARRGEVVIAETSHGFVLAAAGVDASNVSPGHALPLPRDPDRSARAIRAEIWRRTAVNVAVIVTDTAGRAWRLGQIDVAVGCAGIEALIDLRGQLDTAGNELVVTTPALVDEIASAADLVKGKTSGRPVAVARGLASHVLEPGDDGGGVATLVREAASDLFGLGARDAVVVAALRDEPDQMRHFPGSDPTEVNPFAKVESSRPDVRLVATSSADGTGWLVDIDVDRATGGDAAWVEAGRLAERCETLAVAFGLQRSPVPDGSPRDGDWRSAARIHWIVA